MKAIFLYFPSQTWILYINNNLCCASNVNKLKQIKMKTTFNSVRSGDYLLFLSQLPVAHQYSLDNSTEMNFLTTGNINCITFIHASKISANCHGLGRWSKMYYQGQCLSHLCFSVMCLYQLSESWLCSLQQVCPVIMIY